MMPSSPLARAGIVETAHMLLMSLILMLRMDWLGDE